MADERVHSDAEEDKVQAHPADPYQTLVGSSALEWFQQDKTQQLTTCNRKGRQAYFQTLFSLLYQELEQGGMSPLLDKMLDTWQKDKKAECPLLVYSALMECYQMIVFGQEMADSTVTVPEFFLKDDQPMTWEDLARFPQDPMVPVKGNFLLRMRVLRAVSFRLREVVSSVAGAGSADAALRNELDAMRMMAAMHDETLQSIQKQNAELAEENQALRQGLADKATGDMIEKRMAAFEQEQAERVRQAEEDARATYTATIASQQESLRLNLEAESRWASDAYADAESAYVTVRQDLARFQEEQARWAQNWQRSLYKADHRMLAQCYVGMSATLQSAMDTAVLRLTVPGVTAEYLQPLLDLRGTLLTELNRLEHAMKRLGLTVIRPVAGDLFMPSMHCLQSAGTEVLPEGTLIESCVSPGVLANREDLNFRETLVPAVVTVAK